MTVPEPRDGELPPIPPTHQPHRGLSLLVHGADLDFEPGTIVYADLRGDTAHWPAGGHWDAAQLGNLDLAVLRTLLVSALQRVEDELGGRGLLDRVTPRLND